MILTNLDLDVFDRHWIRSVLFLLLGATLRLDLSIARRPAHGLFYPAANVEVFVRSFVFHSLVPSPNRLLAHGAVSGCAVATTPELTPWLWLPGCYVPRASVAGDRLKYSVRSSRSRGWSSSGNAEVGRFCGSDPDYLALMTDGQLGYVKTNVAAWEARRADQLLLGRRRWSADEPIWGLFGIPESAVGLLPTDLDGARTVELGCGTAYVSAWLARRRARPIGVDPTPGQLRIAGQFQDEYGLRFPLLQATAEQVPLQDASFDLAISEHGAAIWADPYRWIPEAARLLRPGGDLVFLGNSATIRSLPRRGRNSGPARKRGRRVGCRQSSGLPSWCLVSS